MTNTIQGSGLKILMLGGAGMIATAVSKAATAAGHDVTVTTRAETTERGIPSGVEQLVVAANDREALARALGDRSFDVVINWVGFSADDVRWAPEFFGGRTKQYIFISTCVVYSRPVALLPVTESSPRRQPDLEYGRNKLEAELVLEAAFRETKFPLTIIRPSHTYDETKIPMLGGWTVVDRMRRDLPVVVHGDGTSLWALLHVRDFAAALLPILGNVLAVGEAVNIVSTEIINWDQIHQTLASAANAPEPKLVHRSSESIGEFLPFWAIPLRDEFRNSLVFDTTKLQRLAPDYHQTTSFSQGAREMIAWRDGDETRRGVEDWINGAFDALTGPR